MVRAGQTDNFGTFRMATPTEIRIPGPPHLLGADPKHRDGARVLRSTGIISHPAVILDPRVIIDSQDLAVTGRRPTRGLAGGDIGAAKFPQTISHYPLQRLPSLMRLHLGNFAQSPEITPGP